MGAESTTVKRASDKQAGPAPGRQAFHSAQWNSDSSPARILPESFATIPSTPAETPDSSAKKISGPLLPLQRKLAIGAVNDPLEAEADAVANLVMQGDSASPAAHSSAPAIRRKCSCEGSGAPCASCEEEKNKLQRKAAGAVTPTEAPPIVHEVLRSPGQPLDTATRAFMEPRLGHDLSKVRIHTDSHAQQSALAVNALAYTVGNDLVFGGGHFAPQTIAGRRLLAHELAHVIQQTELGPATHQRTPGLQPAGAAKLQRKVLNNVVEDFQTGAKACLVHLHGEERTALAVAEELRTRRCVNLMHLDTHKGCSGTDCRFINFEFTAGGFDFVGKADPNRIFTAGGRAGRDAIKETNAKPGQAGAAKVPAKTVRAAAEAELQTFADGNLIPSLTKCRANAGLPVLALHNNEGLDPRSSKIKPVASTTRSPNPAMGDAANPHDFFLATQPSDFDALKQTHNVILQENPVQLKNDDGSLSVFLADQRFINLEKEGRNHDKLTAAGLHDAVYLRDYSLAAEALDLMGVPDMPCGASPDFKQKTKSIFNRRLGQSGRMPTKLKTDRPFLSPDLTGLSVGDCLIFKDQPALDRRADEWREKLDRIPIVNMIHWVLGGGKFTPADALSEFQQQQKCLIDVMTKALKAKGMSLPAGSLVKSETRSFKDQESIWKRKFAFTGAPFDRISAFARTKCAALVGSAIQWDPANKDHKDCWLNKLTDDEKQKEILMASSAPGISRHHLGVDFDFGQTDKDMEAGAWTGSGRFSDSYSWLARNASAFGFIQPFDTKGSYGTGYITERWHWSYFPVAQAALEFVMDHEAEVDAKLRELWGDGKGGIKPEFSFIATNWQSYLFNVEQEGIF